MSSCIYRCNIWAEKQNIPIAEEVMDERRPSTQETGSDMAIALEFSFLTCMRANMFNREPYVFCSGVQKIYPTRSYQ